MIYPNRPSPERAKAAATDHRVRRNQPKLAEWFKKLLRKVRTGKGGRVMKCRHYRNLATGTVNRYHLQSLPPGTKYEEVTVLPTADWLRLVELLKKLDESVYPPTDQGQDEAGADWDEINKLIASVNGGE